MEEGEGGDDFFEFIAGDGASIGVAGELVDEVKIDVSEVARGVIEGGLGVGGAIAAVVQIVEGGVHFEELGGAGGEGGEVAAASIDGDGAGVDADGEDEAILVGGGEGSGAMVGSANVSRGLEQVLTTALIRAVYDFDIVGDAEVVVGLVDGGYFGVDVVVDGEVVAFEGACGEAI